MKRISLNKILADASKQVKSWPKWAQKLEHRQRPPVGNTYKQEEG